MGRKGAMVIFYQSGYWPRTQLGSEMSTVTAWLRALTERGGHTRSSRESSPEACLRWSVLPALGYMPGSIAKGCLQILKD